MSLGHFPGLSARTPPVFDEQSCVEAGLMKGVFINLKLD